MLRIPQGMAGRKRVLHLLGWLVAALTVVGVLGLTIGVVREVTATIAGHDPGALEAIRDSRVRALRAYFHEREDAAILFAHSREVTGGLLAFSQAYKGVSQLVANTPEPTVKAWREELSRFVDKKSEKDGLPLPREEYLAQGPQSLVLQALYLAKSPDVAVAPETASYRYAHSVWNDALVRMADFGGLKDLMLVDLVGNVVYTARKNLDFAVNLRWNLHPNTGVRKAYESAMQAPDDLRVFQSDLVKSLFEPDVVAIHWAVPVFSGGKKIGVCIASRAIGDLSQIMGGVDGLGRTGETYLVGEDLRMRSPSRLFGTSLMLKQELAAELGSEVPEHGSVHVLETNYRGVKTLAAAAPVEFSGGRWVVVSEMAYDEVMAAAQELAKRIAWMALGLAVFLWLVLYGGYRVLSRMQADAQGG